MRAFQPKGYTCMHLHSKTPNQTDIQDETVGYYIYISHPPVLFWHMPRCLSRQQITIQDVSMKYGRFKGIMIDQYSTHLYSYVHTSILTFFLILTHFTVCITIHTVCRLRWYCSSIRVLKIVYFFFCIGSQLCAECQISLLQQLELAPLSEPGIELSLFGCALLT